MSMKPEALSDIMARMNIPDIVEDTREERKINAMKTVETECDMCGFSDRRKKGADPQVDWYQVSIEREGQTIFDDDLCPDCVNKVLIYINNKGKP